MPINGPDLDNPNLFECRPGVPILDVHRRGDWVVDRNRLELVAANSNARAERGELGLMLLGHTTDDGKEADQPPVVGYMKNYQMGQYQGRDCILADLHYDKADAPRVMKNYPRRSVEAYYSDTRPEHNYIDSVAVLVRPSARDLGYVTYSKAKHRYARTDLVKERYSMAESTAAVGITLENVDEFLSWAKREQISDLDGAVRGFLQAQADGTADGAKLGKADVASLVQYMADNNIPSEQYALGLARYSADKAAGKLTR